MEGPEKGPYVVLGLCYFRVTKLISDAWQDGSNRRFYIAQLEFN